MAEKPKLAMYWASGCGGCEVALVNLHERILEVDSALDFVFCPCLLDTKKKDIEAMPDKSLAATFFNGAIGTSDNEEMALLLRRKSQLLLAFGACSSQGGIPALGNLQHRQEYVGAIYGEGSPSGNPAGVLPTLKTEVPEGELDLPALFDTVKTLDQVVEVDYFVPGCPPEPHQIWSIVEAFIKGKELPPRGSVLGGGRSTVCEECRHNKSDKKIARFYRTFEMVPDPEICLLEQGIPCIGAATRDGCGALCPQVNMPCIGCYGPPEGACDQGAKMLAALGSVLDIGDYKGLSEDQVVQRTDAVLEGLPDCAGTFYKFSAAGSVLRGRWR
jgi:F420-non-reducing hydrogenase small subunit